MSKRRKTTQGGRPAFAIVKQVRPIDKKLVSVNKLLVGTAQVATVIIQATFPCTVTGIRWILAGKNVLASDIIVDWALVLDKEGLQTNTMSISDGGDFYTPEQNVLAFGRHRMEATSSPNGNANFHDKGSTKTMRKLQNGDILALLIRCNTAAGVDVTGIIQLFCKS